MSNEQAYANIIGTHRIFQTFTCKGCRAYFALRNEEDKEKGMCHRCEKMTLFNRGKEGAITNI